MSALSELQPEEQELVISLPYRAGVWISNTDDAEGDDDDEKELKTLETIIKAYAKKVENYPFISEVMQATLSNQQRWDSWAADSFDIIPDCEKAVTLLKSNINKQALKNYRMVLYKVASEVAGAADEFDADGTDEDGLVGKLKGLLVKSKKQEGFMNISPAEDAALQRLKEALTTED